jgi:flagellar biosynthetic protein FlhB
MAQGRQDLDANEPATQFKLEKARERGSIVRSTELVFAFVLLTGVGCVYGLSARALDDMTLLLARGLRFASREQLGPAAVLTYTKTLGMHALAAIAPIVFAIWIVALLVAAVQARGVFTTHPLKPDFSRVNPATGFKRIWSAKSLLELVRTSAKLVVLSAAMWVWGMHHLPDIVRLSAQAPRLAVQSGTALLGSALTVLAGVVLAFALLDWMINRWEFMRQMRMSKRDIKDEHKEREGDPRIKARLRELRLEWLKRARQLANVRSADVLLTNPTHYAVALEYRAGEMPAPIITARGAGELAQRMRAEARRRAVPIVEHAPLARALFALKDSQQLVPEEYFDQVARVLRWVYAARGTGASESAA